MVPDYFFCAKHIYTENVLKYYFYKNLLKNFIHMGNYSIKAMPIIKSTTPNMDRVAATMRCTKHVSDLNDTKAKKF